MTYRTIALDKLDVNQANDRHGELENETAAIAWLFSNHGAQMKKLARDIASTGGIYEPPLVYPSDGKFVVYDGNRRTTCLKLISKPRRAPSIELQKFFSDLHGKWNGTIPTAIMCRVETDRDRIDEILFRRHTGSQGGVGQANWDGRMKTTFVNLTGKGGGLNVADEIEERLREAKMLPGRKKIPRTNLNRLLSAEAFRNRVGISCNKGKFQFIRKEDASLAALARIAKDLADKKITLDDVWDVERKSAYLDQLEGEGVLPTAADAIEPSKKSKKTQAKPLPKPKAKKPERRTHLIPQEDYGVAWAGRLQRQRAIWEELQFALELEHHPNAIAVLCRVLLEQSVDNYLVRAKLTTAFEHDALAKKIISSAENLHQKAKIDKRYLEVIRKARTIDAIISVDTLNKYVHSSRLAPSPDHLTAIWDTFAELIVLCLNE
ncbi:hypothetical protein [Porphyrobacter sp. HT-58-2]|uniref:hypothetical protein n=1 Tax=Porphyrobacter sp. HT-58-2 TaxID=2023229 RepID=UPI0018F8687A|nr:hypothetical protein [Porphyrobacter sp. HT-58-2]